MFVASFSFSPHILFIQMALKFFSPASERLAQVAMRGDLVACKKICDDEPDVNLGNALYAAALYGHQDVMLFFLEKDKTALAAALFLAFQTKNTSEVPFKALLGFLPGGKDVFAGMSPQ